MLCVARALPETNKHTIIPRHIMTYSPLKSNLTRAAIAVMLLTSAAHAQILLSGKITGMFTDSPGPNDSIFNAPDGSSAYFISGVPEHVSDSPTKIEFTQQTFTDVGPGLVATDIFKVTNGRNLLHTTASDAHFNLSLELTGPTAFSTQLTTIPFTIVNTPNGTGSVDDDFGISSSSIAPFVINNTRVQFHFSAPGGFALEENASDFVGNLSVTFTPVPEPSTYALTAAALILGAVGLRALRRHTETAHTSTTLG